MATFDDVQADIDAARTAMKSGDYDWAQILLASAAAGLAAIPDTQKGNERMTFMREAIRIAHDTCHKLGAAKTGIRLSRVQYVRPGRPSWEQVGE